MDISTETSFSSPEESQEFLLDKNEPLPSTSKEFPTDIDETASEELDQLIPDDGNSYPFYRLITEFQLRYAIPKSLFTDDSKREEVTVNLDVDFQKVDEKYNFTRYFTLKCYPNGDCPENKDYISLMFETNEDEMLFELRSLNLTLSLLDSDKNQRFSQSITLDHKERIIFHPDGGVTIKNLIFGLNRYVKRDTLLSSELFCDEKLLLQCEVQYHTTENVLDDESPYVVEESYDETGQHISIILVTSHPLWTLLCEKSPYFHKLIKVYGVEDICSYNRSECRSLEIIVRCIISGTDPDMHDLSMQEVFDLYEFCDYILISEFKEKCAKILKTRMTARIASKVIVMADAHNDSELKNSSILYTLQHWRKVVASKSWKILKKGRPDLVKEINEAKETKDNPSQKRKRDSDSDDESVDQFQFYQ